MNQKAIKGKIKSTQSIKKITRTMEMVSVAKMKKAVNLADGYKAFGVHAKNILGVLSDQREKTIYTEGNGVDKKVIILIAGQKGLCGGYNSNIYRYIYKTYKNEAKNLNFVCIGKYAEKIAKKFSIVDKDVRKENILSSFIEKEFLISDARVIVNQLIDMYKKEEIGKVSIVYTDFKNVSSSFVEEVDLLPFSKKSFTQDENVKKDNMVTDDLEYTFEPGVEEVYVSVINVLLQNVISGSVLRARASEHSARMQAMKTATDNASELLSDLKVYYNKARQAAITQEIAEISSAAVAMQK